MRQGDKNEYTKTTKILFEVNKIDENRKFRKGI